QHQPIHERILAPADGLVVRLAHADLGKAQRGIQRDGRWIRRSHFEENILHLRRTRALQQEVHQLATDAATALILAHADVQDVSLARAVRHDSVADDLIAALDDAAEVTDSYAVAKDAFAPGKRVGGAL